MGTPTPPHRANDGTAKPPALLTRAQVAELLHVSKDTVWKLTASGRLGCYRLPRRVFYTEEQVATYLASCEQRPAVPGFRRKH